MKKSFLSFVLLLAVTALNAQTLIKANFQKGDQATYESVADFKLSVPMVGTSESIKTNSQTKITVKDASADGYVIERQAGGCTADRKHAEPIPQQYPNALKD